MLIVYIQYLKLGSIQTFSGGGGAFFDWAIFHRDNFQWEGKFLGGEISKGNFVLEEFAGIPIRNSFYLPYVLFAKHNFTCRDAKENLLREKFLQG